MLILKPSASFIIFVRVERTLASFVPMGLSGTKKTSHVQTGKGLIVQKRGSVCQAIMWMILAPNKNS